MSIRDAVDAVVEVHHHLEELAEVLVHAVQDVVDVRRADEDDLDVDDQVDELHLPVVVAVEVLDDEALRLVLDAQARHVETPRDGVVDDADHRPVDDGRRLGQAVLVVDDDVPELAVRPVARLPPLDPGDDRP